MKPLKGMNEPQLREFIETGLPQELPDWRDARVVGEFLRAVPFAPRFGIRLQEIPQQAIRIGNHGTEFEALESPPPIAHARVAKHYRTGIGQFNQN